MWKRLLYTMHKEIFSVMSYPASALAIQIIFVLFSWRVSGSDAMGVPFMHSPLRSMHIVFCCVVSVLRSSATPPAESPAVMFFGNRLLKKNPASASYLNLSVFLVAVVSTL